MLSSSPVAMARDESLVIISSSPEFPSICDLLPKRATRPALRSGSNVAPIPSEAPKAYTSAQSMWRMAEQEDDWDRMDRDDPIVERTAPLGSRASAAIELSPEPVLEGKSSSSRTKKVGAPSRPKEEKQDAVTSRGGLAQDATPILPVDGLAPKKRGRKPNADPSMAQTTLPKGKVTKPVAKEKTTKKRLETISMHFSKETSEPKDPCKPTSKLVDNEPGELEPAMKRRLDWTPPRESNTITLISDSSTIQDTSALTTSPARSIVSPKEDIFKTLHDTFGRQTDEDSANTSGSSDILGKRKHIQMFVNPTPPPVPSESAMQLPENSPPKKAAKKKPRTLTELATAAYRPEAESVPKNQGSLLSFVEVVNEKGDGVQLAAPAKGKASKKTSKSATSKKKAEPRKQVLLSPASAMRQVSRQDFVFGTSSQLAKEDDPDLLRALHQAMKASNQTDSDPFALSSPITNEFVMRKKSESRLWGAGARDEEGELLTLEVLDLTDSPPVTNDFVLSQKLPAHSRPPSLPLPAQPAKAALVEAKASSQVQVADELSSDVIDLRDSPPITNVQSIFFSTPKPVSAPSNPVEDEQQELDDFDFMPPPSNQEHHQLLLSQAKTPRSTQPKEPRQPKYELYTDAQLARDVAKYGFKPVKKRTAMIALLDQCWASRNQPGLSTQLAMSTSSPVQATSKPTATGSPRGRPRKNSLDSAPVPSQQPAITDYESLKIPDLKKLLQERSLKVSGNKPNLVARLQEWDKQQAASIPKSPRGRPRKDGSTSPVKSPKAKAKSPARRATSPQRATSLKRVTGVSTPRRRRNSFIEIQDSDMDSDSDPFASPPASSRGSRRVGEEDIFSSPPPMDLSSTEEADMSLVASPTTQQASMFGYITKAVTSAPPTKDAADPSWYEKMLMYDPIILEDLAEWLNSGELGRVGYDREVNPIDVKRWCQSKSVCCLWRVTNRQRERKRF